MSRVYFVSSRLQGQRSLVDKLGDLVEAAGLDFIRPRDLVGIKLSFGERGNTAFLRPPFVRKMVDLVKARGGKPFLTDSNTLYHGHRTNSVDHLTLAVEHGFGLAQVGAPIIMADGLRSESWVEEEVNLRHFKTVKFGSVVREMDALISLAHFKGHLVAGFGGTVKNVGMGLGSRAMKQLMHSGSVRPEFTKIEFCTGCGRCVAVCRHGAIRLEGGHADFLYDRCVSCADCIPACPEKCLKITWTEKPEVMGEKMVETCHGIVRRFQGRCLYVNFLLDITPDCDCFPFCDNPIVPNVGILASTDMIAVDMASADLLNAQESIPDSKIGRRDGGVDKLAVLHPEIDWRAHLRYGQEIGLGNCEYTLVRLEA
jgi:uncharacterized Fe-S center protein